MIRVLTVMGTRPEVIKLAPVLRELERHPDQFESRVCVTAQHREMLDQMLGLFEIEPDFDLDVMRAQQSLGDVTRSVLEGLDPILQQEKPDWLLVQGDTTTVMAAGLSGFYNRVKVGHVEAGLRTHDKRSPYPEEMNRRVAGVLADLHFAPTHWAADNLLREGIPEWSVQVTGNTVIDAMRDVAALPYDAPLATAAGIPDDKKIVVVTAHRGENHGNGIEDICVGLRALAERHDDMHMVFPVHMNPRVREPVYRHLGGISNVTLLDPLDYHSLVWLLDRAHFLITDSGGLQEEATGAGKPVLVMRDSTERPEAVRAGTARLIGSDGEMLLDWGTRLMSDPHTYHQMARALSPYGDGKAAAKIVEGLRSWHGLEKPLPCEPEPEREPVLATAAGNEMWNQQAPRRRFARRMRRNGVAA